MAQKIKNVIVISAGGNRGPYIVEELISSQFNVSGLSRPSSKSTFSAHITVYKTDYSESSLLDAFKSQDAVLSAIATFSTPEQKTIIDAAVKAGVKRFIPSEYGIDTSLRRVTEIVPPAKGKQEVVAHLKTKEREGLSWTVICVGLFLTGDTKATIFDSGDQPYEATNVRQIGKAVASTLLHLPQTENKYIYVNSFTLTQDEVLAALEKASGRKWDVTRSTIKDLAASGHEKLRKGDIANGAVETITAAIYGNGDVNDFGDITALYNEMLGLPKEDLDMVIKGLVEKKKV
ncbi:MAG: hypothetical protein M1830_008438 [Pleopsidium flavum]|nr:MAG: hypothetical protein M1830_008438 [Pleopsidium flavum]